ncbi:CRISPR-associated protein Cas4 [Paraliomyxa miuraensis]|uniref:CRISPR-associated protein Cas4 n=1 Tax=Paraliomyxa miuraensis TaxID=376150 RepID=UPI002258E788|nr:Dna2/Cas4 domain-containing protein [Paraliomyxa miuraensis]
MPERLQHTPPSELADLLPVRMCNELVYCERLFYLEHVQGYFVDSADTVHGRAQHERAARRGRRKTVASSAPTDDPPPEDPELADPPNTLRRTVTLESSALGVRGQFDLLELHPNEVVVIEAKRGGSPPHDDHTWLDHAPPPPLRP